MADNPIVKRQKQLTGQWLDFTRLPDARLCRWLLAPDELGMLSAFYKLQNSEGNDTGDLFLKLSTPFIDSSSYAFDLLQELHEKIQALQLEVEENDLAVKQWRPLPHLPGSSSVLHLLSTLGNFAQCLHLPERFLAIYLQPQAIKNIHAWSDWLVQVLQLGIPNGVRWMLTEEKEKPSLEVIAHYFPKQVVSITADLKMGAAVNELAAVGDPSNPGVQFRQAFVKMTQAVGKQDLALVELTAKKAFKIADTNQWPHMKVAVNMAKGGAYLGKQQHEQAYQIYGEAYQHASKAYQEGDQPSGKLSVTALFSQGAAMLGAGKYDIAVQSYTRAVPYAYEAKDYYNLMEAWRMAGYCYMQLEEDESAWEAYWQALEAGTQLDEDIRTNSTLPYVGKELLKLAQKAGKIDHYHHIQDRMEVLLGQDWNEKATVS